MKVCFWMKDEGIKFNLADTIYGNPGMGGTQFEQAIVSYKLVEMYKELDIHIYTSNRQITASGMKLHYVDEYSSMLSELNGNQDALIFTQADMNSDFCAQLDKTDIYGIAWIHNYLTYEIYKRLVRTRNIKRVVFVSQQLYDHYVDTQIIEKATFIYNCVPEFPDAERIISKDKIIVAFTGAVIRQKGFHVLAKAWKKIVRRFPGAKLYVMGNGLYGGKNDQDKYIKYCNRFLKGDLRNTVKYLGVLGDEKEDLYKEITVGVSNPTGRTETFCLSAVEFEAHKIPVVTYNGFGLLDTVLQDKCGYRIKGSKALAEKIILLIEDQAMNKKLGENGRMFVNSKFTPEHIMPKWYWLLTEGIDMERMPYLFSHENYWDDWKWLRYLNSKVQRVFCRKRRLSIQQFGTWCRWMIKYLKSKLT